MARAMVTRLGFSDDLGTVMYGDNQEEVFLGMSMGRQNTISEATAQKIDAEVRRLVSHACDDARKILTDKRQQLEAVAQALLEFETLTGDEIKGLMAGQPLVRPTDDDGSKGSAGSAVPSTGRAVRPRSEPSGGMEPQPQS